MHVGAKPRAVKGVEPLPAKASDQPGQHIACARRAERVRLDGNDADASIGRGDECMRPFEHEQDIPFRGRILAQLSSDLG